MVNSVARLWPETNPDPGYTHQQALEEHVEDVAKDRDRPWQPKPFGIKTVLQSWGLLPTEDHN